MADLSSQIKQQMQHDAGCPETGFAWETTQTGPGNFDVTADCQDCEASIFEVPMTVSAEPEAEDMEAGS